MFNHLKSTIDKLEYSQKSVALATGISEARLSNLCRMSQDKLEGTIKHREVKSLEAFFEGVYFCYGCDDMISERETVTIEECERGHPYSSEDVCARCGSPDFYTLEFIHINF